MWNFILKMVLPFVVDMALKFGLPPAMEWILKKFPFVPKEILQGIVEIIKKAIENHSAATPEGRKIVRAVAKRDVRRKCSGTACVSETKSL